MEAFGSKGPNVCNLPSNCSEQQKLCRETDSLWVFLLLLSFLELFGILDDLELFKLSKILRFKAS